MFCEKCGNKLDDDALFCENCGTKVIPVGKSVETEDIQAEPVQPESQVMQSQPQVAQPGPQNMGASGAWAATGQQPEMQNMYANNGQQMMGGQPGMPPVQPRKPMSKGAIIGIVIAIVAVIGAIVGMNLYKNRKTTVDITDYYKVEFEGTAPSGEALVEFKSDEFKKDFKGKIRSDAYDSDAEIIESFIYDCGLNNYSLDKAEGLSNGDEVTLNIDIDEKIALNKYHSKIKYAPITQKVEGLSSYITKLSELGEKDLANLKKTAEDAISACIASNYIGYIGNQGMEYLGGYVLVSKDSERADNRVILVHKYSVELKDKGWSDVRSAYWYTVFADVMIQGDGEAQYSMTDYSTPMDSYIYDEIRSGSKRYDYSWDIPSWRIYGYGSLDMLYNALVTQNVDRYEHNDEINDVSGDVIGKSGSSSNESKTENDDENKNDASENEEEEFEGSEGSQESVDGVIFPDALTKKITDDEIDELTDEELQTAINDLSAMAGYVFTKKEELNDYYKKFDWYDPDDSASPSKKTLGKTGYSNYERLVKERDKREGRD